MTIEQKLRQMLCDCGMFEDQAAAVVEMMKQNKANESMAKRWDDSIEGYPPALLSVLWLSARISALEWIDANLPKAWFRPVFSSESLEVKE